MDNNNIMIAAIQETKLTDKSKPKKTPGYTMLRKDRGTDKGGGLAFLINETIHFHTEPNPPGLEQDPHIEAQTIRIPGKGKNLTIRNVYIPPSGSCQNQYKPNLEVLLNNTNETTLILGDFNAHHKSWYTEGNEDSRGKLVIEVIEGKNIGFLNEDQPTRIANGSNTSPDLSLATSDLLPTTSWSTETKLSSDHLPIVLTINGEFKRHKSTNRTYINFAKADWKSFKDSTEAIFATAAHVDDVHKSEKFFRKTVQNAAKKHIPAGRIFKPINSIPSDAANMIKERDEIRQQNSSDPRLPELNKNISKSINDHKKEKWKEHLENCAPGSQKLWKTIKQLSNGQQQQPPNQGISFNNSSTNDPKKIANNFNTQYTPGTNTKPKKESRSTIRKYRKKPTDAPVIITVEQTANAIKKSKNSKALGPDGLSPVMLKNLGPNALKFLTNIYNRCLETTTIPSIWKTGRIIPILKPGKPADAGSSYRPISLLSPAAKILESVILPSITTAVDLANHQHGFRKGHSTTTALHDIYEHIAKGLNKKQPVNRTISVAIDLSKAFDTVDHDILLKDIQELRLNQHIKKFLKAYLRGRQTFVEFRGAKSGFRKMKQGVPQGGVLSPTLFNLYMSKMPAPPKDIKLVTYADDSNVLKSGQTIEKICPDLNAYLGQLDLWFKSRNLFISPSKSSATIFTTFNQELTEELPIFINGEQVPTESKPKFLGVTFDSLLSFKHHADNLKTKVQTKNNVLKALSGTSWGMDKEVLLNTYKSIGQSQLNYACPIWTPNLSKTSWDNLQVAQNTALRTATGCTKMTGIDHLHTESKIMYVKPHCEMISKQYLLSTQKPGHPCQINLNSRPPSRIMKKTLKTRFGNEIKRILPRRRLTDETYKSKLKEIHTKDVAKAIKLIKPNPVLNTPAPNINKDEKNLPRKTRSTLAQLRSGYSSYLNSYLSRINEDFQNVCPNCNQTPHDTKHIFNCPVKPTTLTVKSLWEKPIEAAAFLELPGVNDDGG